MTSRRLTRETKIRWITEAVSGLPTTLLTTDDLRRRIRQAGGPEMSREQVNTVGRSIQPDGLEVDGRRLYYNSSQWTVDSDG